MSSTNAQIASYIRSNFVGSGHQMKIGRSLTVISVATAGDASHTLEPVQSGAVFITANLADGAVIKLPAADSTSVGSYFRIIMVGTPAAAAQISLPNSGTAVFSGITTNIGATAQDTKTQHASLVIPGGRKTLLIDEDAISKGGAPGSMYEFYYKSTTEVYVVAKAYHTESTDANTTNAIADATGY